MIKTICLKKMHGFLALTLIVSCTPQKHFISNEKIPDKLGIYMVNSANIQPNDWAYYTSATDSFITKYNTENKKIKLYNSNRDSNSIKFDFVENYYVDKDMQTLGVAVTAVGLATPFLLIAAQAPIIVAFWYTPKNSTTLFSSLSRDLDSEDNKVTHIIHTRHKFQCIEKQKEKQKQAYYNLLTNTIYELFPSLYISKSGSPSDKKSDKEMVDDIYY